MKILVLSCSPRAGGNSDLLADELIRGLQEAGAQTEKIMAARLKVQPCSHCDQCTRQSFCTVQDDMQALYPKLATCDGMALAAPIYFMAHNAQAKLIIDRCQLFWAAKYSLKQPLVAAGHLRRAVHIAVGATRGPKVFAGSKVTMKWLFDALDMEYCDDLLVEGMDEKGSIRQHPQWLQQAYLMGRHLAESLR